MLCRAWFDEAQAIVNPALAEVWSGKKAPAAAMKEIEAAVNQQLAKPL